MFGINKDLKIHFIGIGGIGMSGIAEVLVKLGYHVSGSDISDNANVQKLREQGVSIYKGHKEDNIQGVQIVVYSSAINYENPEIKKAIELKIPIIKRAEMLAELMRLKFGVAIAGSHGKTTTTSFVSTIFKKLNQSPTCIVGGIVKNLGSQAVHGDSEFLIAEADESDGSFLFLNPIMSVITNIDNDHMDYYKNEENIKKAFSEFANKVPFYGAVLVNGNDKNSADLLNTLRRPHFIYAITGKKQYINQIDYLGKEISYSTSGSSFILEHDGKDYPVTISLAGDHNVQNALGAIAISHQAGLDLNDVCMAISQFEGVGRRFEILLEQDKMIVVDDYGHHPTELKATIETAKAKYASKNLVVVFEPHRYTRTNEFWNEFVDCFSSVTKVYIAPIYAASENEILNITSENLVRAINEKYKNAEFLNDWSFLKKIFEEQSKENTVLLSMGAGSISKATRDMLAEWKS